MPERISLLESYDNKDVITQIYRLAQIVDSGTYKDLAVTRDGNNINFVFTTNDDRVHTYAVPDAGITDVSGSAVGSQVTVTFTMTDGTTKSFTYTATGGVTIDTDQTVTGMKVFSAASTNFSHDVDVGADLNVGGTVEANELTVDTDAFVDGNLAVGGNAYITGNIAGNVTIEGDLDVGNLAIEASGNRSIISNENGVVVNGHDLNKAATVNEANIFVQPQSVKHYNPMFDMESTSSGFAKIRYKNTAMGDFIDSFVITGAGVRTPTPTGSSSLEIVNKAFVSSTDGSTNNLLHREGGEKAAGNKEWTGIQTITRSGTSYQMFVLKNTAFDVTENIARSGNRVIWVDKNDQFMGGFAVNQNSDGTYSVVARVRNSNGTVKETVIAKGDVI